MEVSETFRAAVHHMIRLELKEAENLLHPYIEKHSVTAYTLYAQAAWLKYMISEEKADLKEAQRRMSKAEGRAIQGCDYEHMGFVGSLYKLTGWKGGSKDSQDVFIEYKPEQMSFVNCANLAYIHIMQALAAFRGPAKGYLSGAFKLKAAWRLYRYLYEHDIAKLHKSLSSSLSIPMLRKPSQIASGDDPANTGPATPQLPPSGSNTGNSRSLFSTLKLRKGKSKVGEASTPKGGRKKLSLFASKSTDSNISEGNAEMATEAAIAEVDGDADGEIAGPLGEAGSLLPPSDTADVAGLGLDDNADLGDTTPHREHTVPSTLPPLVVGDIYYGLGSFHFFISMIPEGFQWIAESLGFRADRIGGRQELAYAYHKNGFRAGEALLLLFWMDTFFYKEREKAEAMLLEARDLFEMGGKRPSPMFQYMGGYLARLQGHLDVAVERFQKARNCCHQVPVLQLMCDYEIGWCLYLQCDFAQAINYFEPFMAKFHAPSYRAYCAYQLGCALDMKGRHQDANTHMATVAKYVRKNYTFDHYAARKAAQFLDRGKLPPFERAAVIVTNFLEAKNWLAAYLMLPAARKTLPNPNSPMSHTHTATVEEVATAARTARGLPEIPATDGTITVTVQNVEITDDDSAMFVYFLGKALRGLNHNQEALNCFQRVTEAEAVIKEETYIVPFSYCEVGELLTKEGRLADAKLKLRKAKKEYRDYDFDKPLARRLKLAFDVIDAKER